MEMSKRVRRPTAAAAALIRQRELAERRAQFFSEHGDGPLDASCFAVRKSQIAKAGMGLWTNVWLPAGATILEYTGEVSNSDHDPTDLHVYCFGINANVCIDATDPKKGGLARFVNDSINSAWSDNLRWFITRPGSGDAPQVYFVTTRDIEEDQELFVSYGPDYWQEPRT